MDDDNLFGLTFTCQSHRFVIIKLGRDKMTPKYHYVVSRNYRSYRNGNSATFFSYVWFAKKINDLFSPIYYVITASVSFVSLTLVVLNAR